MENPVILIVSCSSIKPKSLIKLITSETTLKHDDPDVTIQPWYIDTKYYTAEIDIYGITDKFTRNIEFNNRVQALVIHMDTNKTTGLTDLDKWNTLTEDCCPEIRLLICNYCDNKTKITKTTATEWCLKNGFELIELYPSKSNDVHDERDIIAEKFGVERIVEALQTNFWPNMVTKDTKTLNVNERQSDMNLENDLQVDTDSFSELFSELSMFKECIQSVPNMERKQYAEQMMTKLWKALGGDEEEIIDI